MPPRFLLVDDHPLFLGAIHAAIQSAYPEAEIVEAGSIASARETILKREPFDLILLDLSLPGTRGFDGLLELRTQHPRLPIVIVSAHEDPRIIHQAMMHGAAGYISKSVRRGELADAIRDVMNGSVVLPRDYTPPGAGADEAEQAELVRRLATLTPQQLRVLQMLRQGLLNKQIAFALDVGETTVKAHVSEILRKLNVASRTQAVIEVSKIDFDSILESGSGGHDGH
ncbi:MAG: response regulator transcription factor [Hyphomicrobiaceae bacterium]|nr:response regulator transcription factor [Hyphomicrobiaceae bacterium]